MPISQKQIETNFRKMQERKRLYIKYGYDQDASRAFIFNQCLPLKKPILEIGTGKGHMTVLLAKNTDRVVTVDVSPEEQAFAQLNAAAENVLDRVKFVVNDAVDLPYPDREFGMIVSVNAFHHFKQPFAVLGEMIRVCGHKLVIADFNDEGFEIVRRIHLDEGRKHEEECGDFSIVGHYLREHGFSVKKHDGLGQAVYVGERKL